MEKSRFIREIIFAVLLFVSFFLPWISWNLISFSGYQITDISRGLSDIGDTFKLDSINNYKGTIYLAYSLYLIPILSVATIIVGLIGYNPKTVGTFAGLYPLIALIYCLVQYGNIFKMAGIGIYATIISSVLLLYSSLTSTKKHLPNTYRQNLDNPISSTKQEQITPTIPKPTNQTTGDKSIPTFQEWIKSNPGKSIDDYHLKFGNESNI